MLIPGPLIIGLSKLQRHFVRSGTILAAAADDSAQLKVVQEDAPSRVIGALRGTGCEYIERNLGRRVSVAPLLGLEQNLWAWLGFHEEWDAERQIGKNRRYSFRLVGLSIYFGLRHNTFKPQMFRAEWPGCARWDGSEFSVPAAGAGHPHWQFDALESLSDDSLLRRAAELRNRLKSRTGPVVREFSPLSDVDVRDFVTIQSVSRMHFASAAAWWKSAPHCEHVHGPKELEDVENWVRCTLDYIKQELGRL